jgi:predicted  nucleic acid-binding Zn-ribbon protein
VTLSDAIDPEAIKSVQPQDDVWGAIDALRNGSAQIAVIPFSNKITSAESATVAGLASGELKILGQIQRRTNHVLVGLKHNILEVYNAAAETAYGASEFSSASSNLNDRPSDEEKERAAKKQFVFLLHVVHSSKSVFDQTRGKLTASDFRSAIRVEHTPNPMRVLLRDLRDRKAQDIVDAMQRKNRSIRPNDASGGRGGYQPIALFSEPRNVRPIEQDFFSAAVVAEGLLSSAEMVCKTGPDMKQMCSQRLSEITEHLWELKTDAEAPLDLPNNDTTFLVVQAANAKTSKDKKKKFPWATDARRFEARRENLALDIRALETNVSRFEAAAASTAKQLDDERDPMKVIEIKEQAARLDSEISARKSELSAARERLNGQLVNVAGPNPEKASLRAAFLVPVDSAEADWSKAFREFELRMNDRFRGLKLKFDQSPELATHLGKQVLIVSAKIDGGASAKAAQVENEIGSYFKTLKAAETKGPGLIEGFFIWFFGLFGIKLGQEPRKFDAKLLGVYPSWSVSGSSREIWLPEGEKPKKDAATLSLPRPPASSLIGWIMLAALFVLILMLLINALPPGFKAQFMWWFDLIASYVLLPFSPSS